LGDISHPDYFLEVTPSGSAQVLGYLKDMEGRDVPGLLVNRFGKGQAIYCAGYPETAMSLFQFNGNTILFREIDNPPDPKMAALFCGLITNTGTDTVSVENLPEGVVVETYSHAYKGAHGIQVHLLNMAGMVSDMLSSEPNRVTFPDIQALLPDKGKPIQVTVRAQNIRNAFILSPDFDGLFEIPVEKRGDGVVCKLPTFGRYLVIYFNQGETKDIQNLSSLAIRSGWPEIKNIEIPEPPPKKGTLKKIASGEVTSSSSELDEQYDASKAFDGNPGSIWCCVDDYDVNSWWMIDLGSTKEVGKVQVQYRNLDNRFQFVPVSVTVQASSDGTNWINTVNKSDNVPKAGSVYNAAMFEYPVGVSARYLRLLFEDGGTRYAGYKVIELREVKIDLKRKGKL
jgi:hypothetical protein